MCSAVKYNRDLKATISHVYRLPARRINNTIVDSETVSAARTSVQMPIIFMRFYTFDDKQHFFSCYLKSKLNLSNFGFQTNSRVYINEKLTSTNNELLRLAIELKRKGSLFNYHTFRGLVFVRFTQSSKSTCICSKSDFKDINTLRTE